MKILFTADLHLNIPARSPRTGRTAFDVFAEQVELENPEVVVVAGDIGTPAQSARHLILSAYSGNSLIGKEIQKRATSVDFLMCGHTHMPVRERSLHGITCLNVGADYGRFRGIIYDTDGRQIRWIGEPIPNET